MNQPAFDWAIYVEQQAIALNLSLIDRSSVTANFERIAQIAQIVLEFPLPADLVAAPKFEP